MRISLVLILILIFSACISKDVEIQVQNTTVLTEKVNGFIIPLSDTGLSQEICDQKLEENDYQVCLMVLGGSLKDITICEKIEDEVIRKNCIERVAVLKRDIRLCDQSLSPNRCIKKIAVLEDDPKICQMISSGYFIECVMEIIDEDVEGDLCDEFKDLTKKDGCYLAIATNLNRRESCEMIKDKGIKSACYHAQAKINKDVSLCTHVIESYYDQCVKDLALIRLDEDVCAKIDLEWNKLTCLHDIGIVKMSRDICETLPDNITYTCESKAKNCKSFRRSCLEEFLFNQSVKNGNLQGCDNLTNRDKCIEGIALRNDAPAICNLIESEFERISCINKLAVRRGDINVCGLISLQEYQLDCIMDVAIAKEELTTCNLLIGDRRTYCIALVGRDPRYCEKIGYFTATRDYCIHDLAVKLQEPGLCWLISQDGRSFENLAGTVSGCIDAVAEEMHDTEICKFRPVKESICRNNI